MRQEAGYLDAPSSDFDRRRALCCASMHCARELDTDTRGFGASEINAAAHDGVGGGTSEFNDTSQNAAGCSTPELDPGASELNTAPHVTAPELNATVFQARSRD